MSKYRVEIAPQALKELFAIRSYIEEELESPMAAANVVRQLMDAITKLDRFPLRNRVLAQLPDGRELRRVRAGNYVAFYTVVADEVSVLTVLFGKSDLEKRISSIF